MHAPDVSPACDALEPATLSPARARELAAAATRRVCFDIGENRVAVRFSHAAAAAEFADRYGDLIVSEGPTEYETYAVQTGAGTYFRVAGGGSWLLPEPNPSPARVGFFVDIVACNGYLARSSDVGFHAAVLGGTVAAAAVLGRSTAGKTTTAAACVRDGLRLYSDERCIVQRGRVIPFPRRMTLRPGGRAQLLADDATTGRMRDLLEAWRDHDDVTFRPSVFFPGAVGGAPLPLACAFVLDGYGDVAEVRSASVAEIAPALLHAMTSGDEGLARIARLLSVMRDVAVFRLRLGTPAASARAVAETLAREERRFVSS